MELDDGDGQEEPGHQDDGIHLNRVAIAVVIPKQETPLACLKAGEEPDIPR